MRVLYYLDKTNLGGAEIQLLDICNNASQFGITPFIAYGEGSLRAEFEKLPATGQLVSRRFPFDPALILKLSNLITKHKIDILHGFQPVEGLHLHFAKKFSSAKPKFVLSFQGFLPDKKNLKVAEYLLSRADCVIFASNGLKNWLAERIPLNSLRKALIIPNGADPARLNSTHSASGAFSKNIKDELGIKADSILVLMVGNFYRDRRKDQMTLCRATQLAVDSGIDLHTVFVGGIEKGAEEKFAACQNFCLEKKINERVHFLGRRSDVPQILASADLYVMSSFHEGLPVALSEAMLAGVASIVSDIEPHREASANGKAARLFPVQNENKLAEIIIELAKDQALRKQLADRGRQHALEHLSISAHLRALKAAYEEAMQS
jgi:glycosyltransferase involved in cell wall biosynthesis